MITRLTRNWWVFLVRGLLAILLSVLAMVWPTETVRAIVILLGAYALVDGVLTFLTGLVSPSFFGGWWAMLLSGAAGIALGVMTFIWPKAAAIALMYLIAAWAVVRGALDIAAAVYFRRILRREWILIATGLLSILLGIVWAAFPQAGALAMVWLIATYGLVMGMRWIILAFRIRGLGRRAEELRASLP
jgi:uncharacterized membrane protein HdeD (DUF308 family)